MDGTPVAGRPADAAAGDVRSGKERSHRGSHKLSRSSAIGQRRKRQHLHILPVACMPEPEPVVAKAQSSSAAGESSQHPSGVVDFGPGNFAPTPVGTNDPRRAAGQVLDHQGTRLGAPAAMTSG